MNIHAAEPYLVLGILILELCDFICTRLEFRREFNFDRGLVEKKSKPVKPKEVVLAPLPDEEKKL